MHIDVNLCFRLQTSTIWSTRLLLFQVCFTQKMFGTTPDEASFANPNIQDYDIRKIDKFALRLILFSPQVKQQWRRIFFALIFRNIEEKKNLEFLTFETFSRDNRRCVRIAMIILWEWAIVYTKEIAVAKKTRLHYDVTLLLDTYSFWLDKSYALLGCWMCACAFAYALDLLRAVGSWESSYFIILQLSPNLQVLGIIFVQMCILFQWLSSESM